MSNVYTLQTNNDIETDKKNNFYYFVIEIWQLKRWHKINLYSCLIECGFQLLLKQYCHYCYCLKCRKNKESKNPRFSNTINGRTVLFSKCAVYDNRKLRFVKKQESRGFLSKLRIRTPLSYPPILGD